jgi:hypothetical protein
MPGSGIRALARGDEQDPTLVWHRAVRDLDITRLSLVGYVATEFKRLDVLAWRCADSAHARLDYCPDTDMHALRVFVPTRTIPIEKRWSVRWQRQNVRLVSEVEVEGRGITPDIEVPEFEAELVVAGGTGKSATPPPAGKSGGTHDILESRLAEDYQLRIAYQTAQRWLGSK